MAIMAMDTVKKTKLATIIATSLFATKLLAGEWQFTPSLTVNETYSDNVELTVSDPISSLVTQSGLNIDTNYISKFLQFNLSTESVYALYSHDHDLDNDYHSFDGNFRLKLGEKGLSLFATTTLDNKAKNNARNSLADIVSADTVQVETYVGGLAFNTTNSDFHVDSLISYNRSQSDDDIGNFEGYITSIDSASGSAARHVFWDVAGKYQERKNLGQSARMYLGEVKLGLITTWKINPFLRYYDEDIKGNINSNRSYESSAYGAGIRWLVTPRLIFDLSYNKPLGNSTDIDEKKPDNYIDASMEWQPSTRTQLNANYSQRFFGDSYGLSLTHRNRRLTNSISYQEEVQSFTRNNYNSILLGDFWCPIGDNIELNKCFAQNDGNINFDQYQLIRLTDFELVEDNILSLNKSFSWISELQLARSKFSLTLRANDRENLATRVEDKNSSIKFSASRKVSGKSDIILNASYTDNLYRKATNSERHDRYRQISISYNKSLNSRLNFDLNLGHVNRSSSATQYNYEEDRVTFKITKDF